MNLRVTLVCILLSALACAGPSEAATASDGERAYRSGRFTEARRVWTPLAEQGDVVAQFGLGVLFDLGKGVAADPDEAEQWYRRAAESSYGPAEFQLGLARDSGRGGEHNGAEAAMWYGRAAAHGVGRAEFNLAQLYAAGDGVPLNPDQAEAWFRGAADAGVAGASGKLAELRRAARPDAAEADKALVAPHPVSPAADATVLVTGPQGSAELVWDAPAQPVPVQFYVEVVAVESTGPRSVFAGYSDRSAVLAPVDGVAADYAWRVFAVGLTVPQYATSEWSRFSVQPAS